MDTLAQDNPKLAGDRDELRAAVALEEREGT